MSHLEVANAVLATFNGSRIERRSSGWYVCWQERGQIVSKRWQCLGGQDFYPVWHRKWPGGGTASTALSQLIRWLRGQPVLPISSWRWWAGDKCKLLPDHAVEMLIAGGYPVHAKCDLCGDKLAAGLDWWNLNGVSGPFCGWRTGCQQKGGEG